MYSVWAKVLSYGHARKDFGQPASLDRPRRRRISRDEAESYIREQISIMRRGGYQAKGSMENGFLLQNQDGVTWKVFISQEMGAEAA